MALLGRDQIDSADDIRTEDVEVPEWGGSVRLRGLTGAERDAYEARMVAMRQGGKDVELRLRDYRSAMVAKCLVGEDGKRLFSDNEIKNLAAKSGAVLDRLHTVAVRLSGMDQGSKEAARGNSQAAPSGASTSD